MNPGTDGPSRRHTRRLTLLRFADAASFSFAWIAIGLWAARTGGSASFAAVTASVYLAYPAAVAATGPAVRRWGAKATLIASSLTSGILLSAAFLALASPGQRALLLSLVAAQSFAGTTASEIVKHSAARHQVEGALSRIMAAYRLGMGGGGLAAGWLAGHATDTTLIAAGIAAAAASTASLLASASSVPRSRTRPSGTLEALRNARKRHLIPHVALSLTLAPAIAIAPGVVAQNHGELSAGWLVAAVAAGATLGPHARRTFTRHPAWTAPVTIAAAAAAAGVAGRMPLALAIIPAAAAIYDSHTVEKEEEAHAEAPDEPGVLALPALIWSTGVGAASLPLEAAYTTIGAAPTMLLCAAATTAAWLHTRKETHGGQGGRKTGE